MQQQLLPVNNTIGNATLSKPKTQVKTQSKNSLWVQKSLLLQPKKMECLNIAARQPVTTDNQLFKIHNEERRQVYNV